MLLTKTAYYGLDNLDGKDDRSKKWEKERLSRGFDSTELWSLGDTIINFSLPRIKEMQKIEEKTNSNYHKELKKNYERLIEGLEIFVRDNGSRMFTKKEEKKVNKSLKLFGEMLPGMWF